MYSFINIDMKIFVDAYFKSLCPLPSTQFDSYSEIPNDCDLICVSIKPTYPEQVDSILDILYPKTNKLLINLSELDPVYQGEFLEFVVRCQRPNTFIFSNSVINLYTPEGYYPHFDWGNIFVTPIWQEQISSLNNSNKSIKFECSLSRPSHHQDIISSYHSRSRFKDQILLDYQGLNPGIPVDVYNQTYYSIVVETNSHLIYSRHTKMIANPIIAKRLFIVVGSRHYLRNMRNLGFKTFDNIIDESYDEIGNLGLRMLRVWDQIDWLFKQDPNEIYAEIESVLEHNYQHLINSDWDQPIKNILTHSCECVY